MDTSLVSNRSELLNRINSPADVKELTIPQLLQLAQEIRELVVKTVSKTGGHLGPSLGVVELTLALHYVYDFAVDRLVWDVGHQCYPHKLLTGRREQFATLRQLGGISGFPKRSESLYDHFGTGHAGTAVSAVLGMALARDALGKDHSVVAVVGDGAATEGMVFEGLNHAGDSATDITVVLNDNAWSISPSVGGLNEYLNRLITMPAYQKLRDEMWRFTGVLPTESKRKVRKAVHRFQESVKNLLVPGTLFEELGFRYIGPVDGHNCSALIRTFKYVKNLKCPVLVHVMTQKGRGYAPAESDGQRLHGVGPFDVSKAKPDISGGITFTRVFGTTLVDFAKERSNVFAITAAMPVGTGLQFFADAYPDRFIDVGIAEQHAVTLAAGMAAEGLKPVVAIYSSFLQRAYDQVIHDVCLQKLPVALFLDRAGLVGEDGPTHHGAYDLSYLRPIPDLVLISPADEAELQRAMAFALNFDSGPVAVRFPRGKGPGIALEEPISAFPLGKGRLLRQGHGVAIIGVGPVVYEGLKAAELLVEAGIDIAVVDARFVKPLDEELLLDIGKRSRLILTIEDNVLAGGFGSAIRELYGEKLPLPPRMVSIGLPDRFVQHGDVTILRDMMGLSAEKITERVREELAADGEE